MDVVLGEWNDHGNKGRLRLSAQDSQRVDTVEELILKHGNKHIMSIEDTEDLRKAIKYTALRDVEGFGMQEARDAVKLYNRHHDIGMDPDSALEGWNLRRKIDE